MGKLLGIDIGGTYIKAGVFSEEGALSKTAKFPTDEAVGDGEHAALMKGLIDLLEAAGVRPSDVAGVGVDVPGAVDNSGAVMMPNIDLDSKGLMAALETAFPRARFAFVNDANAAALGELWQGAGRGVSDFVMIALGTGVGAGVVVNGALVAGAFGAAGELGHLTVNRGEQSKCGCGRCGCLEQYASASGVVRTYLRECTVRGMDPVGLAGPTDTLSVFDAYRSGDAAAQAAVSLMCESLGYAMAQVSVIADPSRYIIGGGMGEGFELFADELRRAFRKNCMSASIDAQIIPAALGNDAALYGGAYLASLEESPCIRG